ncbi:MAG: hypothetical protein M3450_11740 [Actinomycetota bacterium]|nr:hypothetical protein [Actinomycetota bacterium]
MPDEDLARSWERSAAALEEVRRSLTDPGAAELAPYREFLEHNELGLALDTLVDVAEAQRVPVATWRALAAIAAEMDLGTADGVHDLTVAKIEKWAAAVDRPP